MARTPRASVSKTSGQGVSRLSYQRGYALRGGGGGDTPKVDAKFEKPDGPGRQYAKGSSKTAKGPGINISYERTIPIGDLDDIENVARGKARKSSVKLDIGERKKLK